MCVRFFDATVPLAYSRYHGAGRRGSFAAKVVSVIPVAELTITLGFGYINVFNSEPRAEWERCRC
jgi:putative spermidine/putrescine transport system permease protein